MKKLVLFGDSHFGRFGKHLINELESRLENCDVYNCAAGGWDTNDCLAKSSYIKNLQPDIVVISLGTNDASPWKEVDLALFEQNLLKIFNEFSNSKVIYFPPPSVNEKMLESKRKLLTNKILESYENVAKKVCDKQGVTFLDTGKYFSKLLGENIIYHVEDGLHLNDKGYRIFISELSAKIQ